MKQIWLRGSQIANKKGLLNSSACICDLGFRGSTKKSSNCCIKTFSNFSNNYGRSQWCQGLGQNSLF